MAAAGLSEAEEAPGFHSQTRSNSGHPEVIADAEWQQSAVTHLCCENRRNNRNTPVKSIVYGNVAGEDRHHRRLSAYLKSERLKRTYQNEIHLFNSRCIQHPTGGLCL